LLSREDRDQPAGVRSPEPYSAILRRRCHDIRTRRTECGAVYAAGVTSENRLFGPVFNTPNPGRPIARSGHDPSTVFAERDVRQRLAVTLQGENDVAVLYQPEA